VGRLVPAVARALDILEFVRAEGLSAAPEITRALGLPRTTVHELIKTLLTRGYLREANGGDQYELGIRLLELGAAYEARLDLAQVAKASAVTVRNKCGETVHVAVLDRADVVYIVQIESTHVVRMVSALGGRLPAHVTAVGKALLAYQPAAVIDELYPEGTALSVMTPASLKTAGALRSALERIRQEGLAWDACESNPDVYCVAAPIMDRSGSVIAAMSVSVPSHRWNAGHATELAGLVTDAAHGVSRHLGYSLP
jgi:IclR family transcriptional regulator, KDG regulon repressor